MSNLRRIRICQDVVYEFFALVQNITNCWFRKIYVHIRVFNI